MVAWMGDGRWEMGERPTELMDCTLQSLCLLQISFKEESTQSENLAVATGDR
jgi:hypothetical protein